MQESFSFPHLKDSPITEAMVEIQTSSTVPYDKEKTEIKLKELFPNALSIQGLVNFKTSIQKKPENPTPEHAFEINDNGFLVNISSEVLINDLSISPNIQHLNVVMQFRPDAFSISCLKPYPGWDIFNKIFNYGWKKYQEIFKSSPQRTVLRNINQFQVSNDKLDLVNVLNNVPFLPQFEEPYYVPIVISENLTKYELQISNSPYRISIIQILKPGLFENGQNILNIIYDISVVCELSLNDSEIQTSLLDMREYKNRMFFAAIAEPQLKKFE